MFGVNHFIESSLRCIFADTSVLTWLEKKKAVKILIWHHICNILPCFWTMKYNNFKINKRITFQKESFDEIFLFHRNFCIHSSNKQSPATLEFCLHFQWNRFNIHKQYFVQQLIDVTDLQILRILLSMYNHPDHIFSNFILIKLLWKLVFQNASHIDPILPTQKKSP